MAGLEAIVLNLDASRSLDTKGIKLDTALFWYCGKDSQGVPKWVVVTAFDVNMCSRLYPDSGGPKSVPAPTYTELILELGEEGLESRMVALAHALEALHEEAAQNANRHQENP
jgi:hypothetical protein